MAACSSSKSVAVSKNNRKKLQMPQQLEIRNKEGKKWDSSRKIPNSCVQVVPPPHESKLWWYVEKSPEAALWSFFVLTNNNEKLQLSYEDDVDDITLKHEQDAGEKRWYVALLQPGMGVFLKAAGTENRFIYKCGRFLRMVTTDMPAQNMEWFIGETEMPNYSIPVEIFQSSSSSQWICNGAKLYDPIYVHQTGVQQHWIVSSDEDGNIKIMTKFTKYIAAVVGLSVFIRNPDSTNASSNFSTEQATQGAIYVRTKHNPPRYLGKAKNVLCVFGNKKRATPWHFDFQGFSSSSCDSITE